TGTLRATSEWRTGQSASSLAGLLVPAGTPPGSYRLITGLYDSTTGSRLATTGGDYVDLGMVTVEQPLPAR
ncbi:MAG: hypothetical protein KDI03_23295, partial [Anaerolineae bacterium]|nr:hypothetical protein [Anaerolineae bacterium]